MARMPSAPVAASVAAHVLVVDDERALASLVGGYVRSAGMTAQICHDGLEAVTLARRTEPDVVVLDLGLPGLDGIEVCRALRTFSDCYILMLTARTDEIDKLIGLSVGADDYVTKPFSPRELVARIQALMRRPRTSALTRSTADEPVREFGDLRVDPGGREVWVGGRPVELTPTEFDLLAVLSARPRLAFSRGQLIAEVWGESWRGDERLVDVHIGHLRRKLGDDPSNARYVRTVRGVGYRMGEGQ